jgi:hypothetical protein
MWRLMRKHTLKINILNHLMTKWALERGSFLVLDNDA